MPIIRMRYVDLTLPTPAENLALDEALLEAGEAGGGSGTLRFWEPRDYFVVVGYANRVGQEVDLAACRTLGVPVLRRCSGGGAVLQGPGCLNYNLVLSIEAAGPLASVTATNRLIMERHAAALNTLRPGPWPDPANGASPAHATPRVTVQGITDLAMGDRKFSGNAQRRKHRSLVFHGSFLLAFDLERIEQVLRVPCRQPEYRRHRSHRDFLVNLALPSAAIKSALQQAWDAHEPLDAVPLPRVRELVAQKYAQEDWNLKFR